MKGYISSMYRVSRLRSFESSEACGLRPLAKPLPKEGKALRIRLPSDPEVLRRPSLAENRQHKGPPRLPHQGETLQQGNVQGLRGGQTPLQKDPGPEVQGPPTHAQEIHQVHGGGALQEGACEPPPESR